MPLADTGGEYSHTTSNFLVDESLKPPMTGVVSCHLSLRKTQTNYAIFRL